MPAIMKNLTDVEQSVFKPDGTRVTIPALAEVQLDDETAELFKVQRAQTVIMHEPVAIPNRAGEPLVWMANVTGAPDLPETVPVNRYDKQLGQFVPDKIPNLTKTPQVYLGMFEVGQVEVGRDFDGSPIRENRGSVPVRIPPYTRVPVPASIADWVEQNCQHRPVECRGLVRKCRAPTAYEPNSSWSYEKIYAFMELMDSKSVRDTDIKKPRELRSADSNLVEKHKADLLKRVFFMVIDERYSLPNEAAVTKHVEANGKK